MAGNRVLSLSDAAAQAGVTPGTLRRWAKQGVIPQYDGHWSPAAVAHARVVARMRERGHSLKSIRDATDQGRLAFGYVEELFPDGDRVHTLRDAAGETGL